MKILRNARSVRSILTLWYSFVLLLAFAIFSISVYVYLQRLLEQRLDSSLVDDTEWIRRLLETDSQEHGRSQDGALTDEIQDAISSHFSLNIQNFVVLLQSSSDGSVLYESDNRLDRVMVQDALPLNRTVLRTVDHDQAGSLRIAAHRTQTFLIQVGSTFETIEQVLDHLLSILGILAPVMLFLSVAGGWLLGGIVLKPVKEISNMAKRITAEHLDERIPERMVKDELGELIDTMNATIARLQSSFEDIRQFSMNVAHELKTPLTIMKGESELALNKTLSAAEMQDIIASTLEETTRMSRIVDDLLTLAKADAGQMAVAHDAVPIDQIVRELFEDGLILAEGKGLTIALLRNDPAVIKGDTARVRQLLRALMTNAVQYTDTGGSIRIQSTQSEDGIAISIEDTGIGIAAEHHAKIFQRFYRVDQARTRVRGGSGLGLSMAKWIADSHGGRIDVESSVGAGSRFTVQFPIENPETR